MKNVIVTICCILFCGLLIVGITRQVQNDTGMDLQEIVSNDKDKILSNMNSSSREIEEAERKSSINGIMVTEYEYDENDTELYKDQVSEFGETLGGNTYDRRFDPNALEDVPIVITPEAKTADLDSYERELELSSYRNINDSLETDTDDSDDEDEDEDTSDNEDDDSDNEDEEDEESEDDETITIRRKEENEDDETITIKSKDEEETDTEDEAVEEDVSDDEMREHESDILVKDDIPQETTGDTTTIASAAKPEQSSPIYLIIDTDFSSDVDDAFAISVASYFRDMGLVDLRGVVLSCTSTRAAHAMSALLYAHKNYDATIACDWDDGIAMHNSYHVNMEKFSHSEDFFVDNVSYYRMMLASSEQKVNIICIGQLINLNDLLNSKPDAHSPLTGIELVAQKVDTLYLLAGKHNGKMENNIFYGGTDTGMNKYYNNSKVTEAAKNVAKVWPTRVVWYEADLTGTFSVGTFLKKNDKAQSDILTKALVDYGTPDGCASFDPFGTWLACMDMLGKVDETNIDLITGTMHINNGGTSYFNDGEQAANHFRMVKKVEDSWYKSEVEKTIAYEFTKRSGKEVIW